jgi:hypothetical protein
MDQRWVRPLAVVVFVGFALVVIFGYYKSNSGDPDNFPSYLQVAVPVVVYLVAGFVIGKWWFVPLMLVPILIAIPAGSIPSDDDELPISVAIAANTFFFLGPLGVAGVVARKLGGRPHPRDSRPSQPGAAG